MNRHFLSTVVTLSSLFFLVGKSHAWDDLPPIPDINNASCQYKCIGCPVQFDGSTSYDQDEGGESIQHWYWYYGDDEYWWHDDGPTPTHTYDAAGEYCVWLYVKDDEGTASLEEDDACCWVYVVEVDKVVQAYTQPPNEGPIYTCLDQPVYLKAIPYPSFPFPEDQPTWTIESQPTGANAVLLPNSDTAQLDDMKVPGNYVVKAKCSNNDTGDTITVTAIAVDHVTVDANATQTNVTGAKNWAAVKKSGEYVIVKAVLNPSISESCVPNCFYWVGGSPVEGHVLKRKVSKATSAKTTVIASTGTSSDYVDIWILWSSVQIKMSGTTPANAVQFGSAYDGTENLGAIIYDSGTKGVGKVVPIATITPAGIHNVVTDGWEFKRDRWGHDFFNGAKDPSYWDTNWTDDTSSASFQNLTPDVNEQIFDRDAPNIANYGHDSDERYGNLRQWVKWNGQVASDQYAYWYFKARWKVDQTPQVTLVQVGSGTIELPDEDEAYYDPP